MRRESVFVLLGLGALFLVGLFVKRGAFERSASQVGTNSARMNERAMPGGNSRQPANDGEAKTEMERNRTPVPVDAKTVRKLVAQRVKKIVAEQLGIESIPAEESQYSELGADDLDCVELMDAFEQEFKIRIPEQDQNRLCASTVEATISYVSGRVGLK